MTPSALILPIMRSILILWMFCFFGLGCNRDYSRTLPDGFVLARTNRFTIAIFSPLGSTPGSRGGLPGVVIGPLIDSLGTDGSIVYGHVSSSPSSEIQGVCEEGFFILNTKDFSRITGLTKEELENQLEALGVEEVELKSV